MAGIRKGDLVEYQEKYSSRVVCGTGKFGVATENERSDGSVLVMHSDRTTFQAKHITAYGWGGWMPEDLEQIYLELNPDPEYEDF